jgi:hypothetical protein
MEKVTTPADVNVSHSRRDRVGMRVMVGCSYIVVGGDANRAGFGIGTIGIVPHGFGQ